jgi:hypothetical protein
MGQIQIEVFEYALMINHDEGLTVVFPEYDHTLMIQEHNGKLTPVARGANLEVCGPGGAPLDPKKPDTTADYQTFVVDLEAAEATTMRVPPDLIDPAKPVDRNEINGRLFLKGGTITGKECSIPTNRGLFGFKGGKFYVTDTAVFTLDVPDGEEFVLSVNGQPKLKLPDGSVTRVMNTDTLGGVPKSFEELDEFIELCHVVGHEGTAPAIGDGIYPMGVEIVCLNAQITKRSDPAESTRQSPSHRKL